MYFSFLMKNYCEMSDNKFKIDMKVHEHHTIHMTQYRNQLILFMEGLFSVLLGYYDIFFFRE